MSINPLLATPWKVVNELRRLALLPYARAYFALHGVRWQAGWKVYGCPLIQRHAGSSIELGERLQLRSWFGSNPLGVNHRIVLATWAAGAEIRIGNQVGLTGTTLCAETAIHIGDRVRIGANSMVADSDFHPIDIAERRANPKGGVSRPIAVEDDVFIGMHVLILKGVTIGQGSVVGAGSVVSHSVPPGVVVAGNPARIIRELEPA
ncbi:MAG: acyltransferase [Caldilineaceae bacterium]|nr:acyltransferase [Caldilineaceae bacterium]